MLLGLELDTIVENLIDVSLYLLDHIKGYSLSTRIENNVLVKSLRYLIEKSEEIPIGVKFRTYVNDRSYTATRNPEYHTAMAETVKRQIDVISSHPLSLIPLEFNDLLWNFNRYDY